MSIARSYVPHYTNFCTSNNNFTAPARSTLKAIRFSCHSASTHLSRISQITALSDLSLSSRRKTTNTLQHAQSQHGACMPLLLATMSTCQTLATVHVRPYRLRLRRQFSAHSARGYLFMQSSRRQRILVYLTTILLRAISITAFQILSHTQTPLPPTLL